MISNPSIMKHLELMTEEIIELYNKSEAEYESMLNDIEEGKINVTYDYAFEKYNRFK